MGGANTPSFESATSASSTEQLEWKLATPAGVAGAVAIIELHGDSRVASGAIGLPPLDVGDVRLRNVLGIDRALVARISERCVQIMPHGGTAVVRAMLEALGARGIREACELSAMQRFPEARDEVEARMLAALSVASSPLAIDVLLDQPRRWRAHRAGGEEVPREVAVVLRRLITPPLVVVVGPANVGKSTLLNRLAGRNVAIVADEAGTTRDHVGAVLDVGGLVIRYVDTPGLRKTSEPIEVAARRAALELAAGADLLIVVGDAGAGIPALSELNVAERVSGRGVLRVGLRGDLGPAPGAALSVSALTGEGLGALADSIRCTLVPEEALRDPRPWRFWEA